MSEHQTSIELYVEQYDLIVSSIYLLDLLFTPILSIFLQWSHSYHKNQRCRLRWWNWLTYETISPPLIRRYVYLYCICITVLQLVDEIADSGKLKKCVKCKISGKLESNKFFGGFYGGGEQLFLACKTNLTSNWSKLELLTLYFPVQW